MDVSECHKCGQYTPLDRDEKEQVCWDCSKDRSNESN